MINKNAGKKTAIMAIGLALLLAAGNLLLDMISGETTVTTTKIALALVAGLIGLGILYLKYLKTEKSIEETIEELKDTIQMTKEEPEEQEEPVEQEEPQEQEESEEDTEIVKGKPVDFEEVEEEIFEEDEE